MTVYFIIAARAAGVDITLEMVALSMVTIPTETELALGMLKVNGGK